MQNFFFSKKLLLNSAYKCFITHQTISNQWAFLQQPCGRFEQSWEILDLQKTKITRTIKIS